jgi:hypothetical protein
MSPSSPTGRAEEDITTFKDDIYLPLDTSIARVSIRKARGVPKSPEKSLVRHFIGADYATLGDVNLVASSMWYGVRSSGNRTSEEYANIHDYQLAWH